MARATVDARATESNILSRLAYVSIAMPACAIGHAQPSTPVILISVDTLRADHIGCYQAVRNQARGELKEAIRLQPEFAWAHYNLALVSKKQEKRDEATQELRAALSADHNCKQHAQSSIEWKPRQSGLGFEKSGCDETYMSSN